MTAETHPAATDHAPVFVLCCARSGSTLLRYILDSHPRFCCPPELHLGQLARRLYWAYGHTSGAAGPDDMQAVRPLVRGDIDRIMNGYAARQRKRTWCEKSVSTIDDIDIVHATWPEARYLCLYRDCLDQVASAQETLSRDPSGRQYGFDPFLRDAGDEPLNGLVDYWCARTGAMLAFEREHPDQCLRVLYESITMDTDAELARLFRFLGDDWESGMTDDIFGTPRPPAPGDHKILATTRIQVGSIGHGAGLDTGRISAERKQRANRLLAELDYPAIG